MASESFDDSDKAAMNSSTTAITTAEHVLRMLRGEARWSKAAMRLSGRLPADMMELLGPPNEPQYIQELATRIGASTKNVLRYLRYFDDVHFFCRQDTPHPSARLSTTEASGLDDVMYSYDLPLPEEMAEANGGASLPHAGTPSTTFDSCCIQQHGSDGGEASLPAVLIDDIAHQKALDEEVYRLLRSDPFTADTLATLQANGHMLSGIRNLADNDVIKIHNGICVAHAVPRHPLTEYLELFPELVVVEDFNNRVVRVPRAEMEAAQGRPRNNNAAIFRILREVDPWDEDRLRSLGPLSGWPEQYSAPDYRYMCTKMGKIKEQLLRRYVALLPRIQWKKYDVIDICQQHMHDDAYFSSYHNEGFTAADDRICFLLRNASADGIKRNPAPLKALGLLSFLQNLQEGEVHKIEDYSWGVIGTNPAPVTEYMRMFPGEIALLGAPWPTEFTKAGAATEMKVKAKAKKGPRSPPRASNRK